MVAAAEELAAPLLVQTSEGAVKQAGLENLVFEPGKRLGGRNPHVHRGILVEPFLEGGGDPRKIRRPP